LKSSPITGTSLSDFLSCFSPDVLLAVVVLAALPAVVTILTSSYICSCHITSCLRLNHLE
jgi:hypothetical protein